MTTCDDIQAQLSDFIDGRLSPDEHAVLRRHVRGCSRCRGLLRDLERVVATARALGPIAPPEPLWLDVAGQIRQSGSPTIASTPRRGVPLPWQWVGLAAAMLIITIALYFMVRTRAPLAITTADGATRGSLQTVGDELDLAMQHYERAIAELEVAARNGNGQVDPGVSATLQRSLGSIDSAISESRAALVGNPDSEPARNSLFEALRRKISVLQATVSLINETRQGDPAGTSRAMEGPGRQS